MTRGNKVKELMSQKDYKGWLKKDVEEEIQDFTDEQINKGYDVFDFNETGMLEILRDFNGTGMLEILRLDALNTFKDDQTAVSQAIKDGVKIIPVNELPDNFDRRYLGWIDTKENRKAIKEYCEKSHIKGKE